MPLVQRTDRPNSPTDNSTGADSDYVGSGGGGVGERRSRWKQNSLSHASIFRADPGRTKD